MEEGVFHLSFYKFFEAKDLPHLKSEIKAKGAGLMGTVLVAPEGINGMVAGSLAAVDNFKHFIQNSLGLEDSAFKKMWAPEQPFRRFLVKIKKEIISIGDAQIKPHHKTGQRISAAEFKQWLDERRPMVVIDTRNDYEVDVGTFEGAQDFRIATFREFASKAQTALANLKDKKEAPPIVTFCTGGIRCEKASAILMEMGLKDVYQLDGGILRYFEQNGAAHFDGNCFVFDWRLAVDGKLNPAPRSATPQANFGRHKVIEAEEA